MERLPPEALRAFPSLSAGFALREGGRAQCPAQVRPRALWTWLAPQPFDFFPPPLGEGGVGALQAERGDGFCVCWTEMLAWH